MSQMSYLLYIINDFLLERKKEILLLGVTYIRSLIH